MENMFDVPVDRRNTGNMKGEIAAGIGGPVPAVMLSGAEMDYPTFEAIAAHRCARVTMTMAKALGI